MGEKNIKFEWPQIIVMFWHTAQDKFIQQVFWFFSMKFSIRVLDDLGFCWRHRSGNYCTVLTWTILLQRSGCLVFSFQSNYTLCQQKLTGSGGMELKIARSQTSSLTFRVVQWHNSIYYLDLQVERWPWPTRTCNTISFVSTITSTIIRSISVCTGSICVTRVACATFINIYNNSCIWSNNQKIMVIILKKLNTCIVISQKNADSCSKKHTK